MTAPIVHPLQKYLSDPDWLRDHEAKIKALLPSTWTHERNVNMLQVGFGLKLLGLDWRSPEDFGRLMTFFERIGFLVRDGHTVRANPRSLFESPIILPG